MPHQCLGCGRTFEEGSSDLLRGCPTCEGTRFYFTKEPLSDAERQELQARSEEDLRELIKDALTSDGRDPFSWSDRQRWLRLDPENVQKTLKEVVEETARQGEAPPVTTPAPGPGGERLEDVDQAPPTGGPDATSPTREPDPVSIDTVGDPDPEPAPEPAADVERLLGRDEPEPTAATPRARRGNLRDLTAPPGEPDVPKRRRTTDPAPPKETAHGDEAIDVVLQPVDDDAPEPPLSTISIREPGRYEIDVDALLGSNPVIVEKDGVYMVHLPSIFSSVEKGRKR